MSLSSLSYLLNFSYFHFSVWRTFSWVCAFVTFQPHWHTLTGTNTDSVRSWASTSKVTDVNTTFCSRDKISLLVACLDFFLLPENSVHSVQRRQTFCFSTTSLKNMSAHAQWDGIGHRMRGLGGGGSGNNHNWWTILFFLLRERELI